MKKTVAIAKYVDIEVDSDNNRYCSGLCRNLFAELPDYVCMLFRKILRLHEESYSAIRCDQCLEAEISEYDEPEGENR